MFVLLLTGTGGLAYASDQANPPDAEECYKEPPEYEAIPKKHQCHEVCVLGRGWYIWGQGEWCGWIPNHSKGA